MKTIYKVLLGALTVGSLQGCVDALEKEPKDIISQNAVYRDPALVDALLLDLYARTPFQQTGGQADFNMGLMAGMGAESRPFGAWQTPYSAAIKVYDETGAGALNYWPYDEIRIANQMIEDITVSDFDQEYKDQRIAEIRFLRAVMYFKMAKRFGGVPLVVDVQDVNAPLEDLWVARNSEKEIYDFVLAELQGASQVLPESYEAADNGRPTKWAATALRSRVALYAASIARFGTVQLDGLLGIPSGEQQQYYTIAKSEAEAVINSGQFALYNKFPDDPAQNFHQLFIDENNNPEPIFSERWDFALNRGHSWDNLCTPAGFNSSWNSNFNVFVDLVEMFDFVDGRSGAIDRSLYTADNSWDIDDFFGNRDPRFQASFFIPETEWQGKLAYFHTGTFATIDGERQYLTSGNIGEWPAAAERRNRIRTGVYIKKRVDESFVEVAGGQSSTDFHYLRLAEMYLNLAEASFYLNEPVDGLLAINKIRERAGMPLLVTLSEDAIRQERAVEFALEEHRYWDLRRWRIADDYLDGRRLQGFDYKYDYDTEEYYITLTNAEAQARVFQERHYYFALGRGKLAENPNLVENPGY
ncbi:RagB/SusD family nutrient uptake outer membrane protein [Echinicola sediminis]